MHVILHYWFGGETADRSQPPSKDQLHKWFGLSNDEDAYITEHYKEDLHKLVKGEYEAWKQDKHGKLAAIVLID
jgi:uncharacterized protein (DUF924 family)